MCNWQYRLIGGMPQTPNLVKKLHLTMCGYLCIMYFCVELKGKFYVIKEIVCALSLQDRTSLDGRTSLGRSTSLDGRT